MIGLGHAAIVNRQTYNKVVCERRFMISATIATSIATVLFIVAMSMAEWVIVRIDLPDKNQTKVVNVAIWGEWLKEFTNGLPSRNPRWISHFPLPETVRRLYLVEALPHFYRTQAVFACVAVGLMIAANSVAVYSLKVHRYMYKRLAAGLHFVTALCILIVIEVMVHSIDQWHKVRQDEAEKKVAAAGGASVGTSASGKPSNSIPSKQSSIKSPPGATEYRIQYSYSTVISWFDFAIFATAAVLFILGSRKRKGSRAATQEFEVEDRPFELGRP